MAAVRFSLLLLSQAAHSQTQKTSREESHSGKELYQAACANCHGADGTGAPQSQVAFDIPLPDFTNCSFATREPNGDWIAVTQEGGPARAFHEMMPAFKDALSIAETEQVLGYIRTFCTNDEWPRGELNLPRPLVTTKAYPEDEAVFTTTIAEQGLDSVVNEIVFEKRFGARNQFEIAIPFGWRERQQRDGDIDWTSGIGDVVLGLKRAVYHSLERGSILSVAAEVVLPTGDEDDGFGSGTTIFEPFLAYGQILPADWFLHAQAGAGLSADTGKAEHEAFGRLALGHSFTSSRFGRT